VFSLKTTKDELDRIVELAKRRGFFWPSFSLYGGVSGFYDYGPLGVLLRDNIIRIWKEKILSIGGIFIDTPNISPEEVFQASGHLERFYDLAAVCASCGSKFKVETLLQDNGIDESRYGEFATAESLNENNIRCPRCGSKFRETTNLSLMFELLNRSGDRGNLYLRPETAQGVFVNFRNLLNFNRDKLPIIAAQLGKGFRNEIAPRQALLRLREFYMGEVEVYLSNDQDFQPESKMKLKLLPRDGVTRFLSPASAVQQKIIRDPNMAYFIEIVYQILLDVGISPERIRFRQHREDELSHYSSDCWDAEVTISGEWVEVVGVADRGTYDLTRHQKYSGSDLTSKDRQGKKFTPRVIEPSFGFDRILLSSMISSYSEREKGYKVLSLPKRVSPHSVAILPLLRKDGLREWALNLYTKYKRLDPYATFDESGSIGRRYARQDEIGTPYCVTVDYDTLNNGTVTVRDRDSTKQIRIKSEILLRDGGIFTASKEFDFTG